MRFLHLAPLLVPVALGAPTSDRSIPDLSVKEWTSIQSGFTDRLWGKLSDWSWTKAEEIVNIAGSHGGGDEDKTIWQQLKDDPNSFSKIVKAIEFAGEPVIKHLDGKKPITFFIPNNDALKPPPGSHHHHHHEHDEDALFAELMTRPSLTTVSSILEADSSLTAFDDKDDDDKKKKRREFFRFIVQKILAYHGLKDAFEIQEIAKNSTIPTALKADDGSFAGLHRRIKVEKTIVPPAVVLNFYAKVLVSDRKASNGYFHTLNHPLIPPPSVFDVAYNFPDYFSTLTSAVQGLGEKDKLEWDWNRKEHKFTGYPLLTLFTPTNLAFHILPEELKFFLFSPFGERALGKILAYHYIPKTLLLTELLVDQRKHHDEHVITEDDIEYFDLDDDPTFHKEFDIHPVLPNSTLHIEIDKVKVLPIEGAVKTTIKVNGQTALAADVQARNGAFHPLGKVLIPPHHHHDHDGKDISGEDTWENWQEWLPDFAAEPIE